MPYNTWYDATYDAITEMADWTVLEADVPAKAVCVFAWMPLTIMNVNGPGDVPRWSLYSVAEVGNVLQRISHHFAPMQLQRLMEVDFRLIEQPLLAVLEEVFPVFGPSAASKFLHFSARYLVPMWDGSIRSSTNLEGSTTDFLTYIRQFKDELAIPANMETALNAYPRNPVRGWDVVKMQSRGA